MEAMKSLQSTWKRATVAPRRSDSRFYNPRFKKRFRIAAPSPFQAPFTRFPAGNLCIQKQGPPGAVFGTWHRCKKSAHVYMNT